MYNLPNKWCILLAPPNVEVINKWFVKNSASKHPDYSKYVGEYLHFPATASTSHRGFSQEYVQKDYTIISFEDFKRAFISQPLIY